MKQDLFKYMVAYPPNRGARELVVVLRGKDELRETF